MCIELPYTQIILSTQTLMEEVQSIDSETDELESQEKSHACASFGILNQSSFR